VTHLPLAQNAPGILTPELPQLLPKLAFQLGLHATTLSANLFVTSPIRREVYLFEVMAFTQYNVLPFVKALLVQIL
jgi:hypothetical protein